MEQEDLIYKSLDTYGIKSNSGRFERVLILFYIQYCNNQQFFIHIDTNCLCRESSSIMTLIMLVQSAAMR